MKICAKCGAQFADDYTFCTTCGAALGESVPAQPGNQFSYEQQAAPDSPDSPDYDDLAKHKLYGILVYLTSLLGIIVALLAAPESPYVRFHVRQALKLAICQAILALAMVLLAWTIIVPVAGGIAMVVLLVVNIICLVNACKGLMKEPPIVKNIGFLK